MFINLAIDAILENIKNASGYIKEDVIKNFVEIISQSGRIFVIGAGRSGLVAKAFGMRLMHLGKTVFIVGETITPAIKANDCIIAISGSGETNSIVSPVKIAKEKGAKVLSLTSYTDSTIGKLSDSVLWVHGRTKNDIDKEEDYIKRQMDGNYSSLTPLGTAFELTSLVFLDGLISELMYAMGATEADLKARHDNMGY
ncbi:MAG: 6-phospho-3-hexuloisomerase [Methanobrevibacter sp.]|jgi:6-phospho-3-hexuloisomerase|nr:6-phospho-3-hexuloisomerase [Candidatus Methanoflexus mossambicus]